MEQKNTGVFALLCIVLLLCGATQAQSWQALGSGCGQNDQSDGVYALAVYGNDLIAAGVFYTAGGAPANNIAAWDGHGWRALGSGIGPASSFTEVYALATYNGDLYAAGNFHQAGGVPAESIARWDGTAWHAVGKGIPQGGINALAVYQGMLYAAGYFTDTVQGDTVHSIERWDGAAWSSVPNIYCSNGYGVDGGIESLCATPNFLYIGGQFQSRTYVTVGSTTLAFRVDNAGRWDTSTAYLSFAPLQDTSGGTGLRYGGQTLGVDVHSMAYHDGKVYLAGLFDSAGSAAMNDIASYDDYTFRSLANPCGNAELIGDMASYQGKLVRQTLIGSGKGVAAYDGTGWSNLGGQFSGSSPFVGRFCQYGGELYAAGQFSNADGTTALNIAKWSAASGIRDVGNGVEIGLYPNPVNESLTIKGLEPNQPIVISDIVGQPLIFGNANAKGESRLDVSMLPKGLYFANKVKFAKD